MIRVVVTSGTRSVTVDVDTAGTDTVGGWAEIAGIAERLFAAIPPPDAPAPPPGEFPTTVSLGFHTENAAPAPPDGPFQDPHATR